MEMYPKNDLYKIYKKNIRCNYFSSIFPDVTKKRTLEVMNLAINCCDSWSSSLDIGGGTGHYSIPLLHKFKKSTVVEVSEHKEHKYLKTKYLNFYYHNDFIENINFKEKFDFVLLADIFEHIVDVNEFVNQISNLQNVGGVIYILTPNPLFCGPAEQSGIHFARCRDGHVKHYTSNEVLKIMSNYGYDIVYFSYEEGSMRQRIKRIIFSLSRKDKNLRDKSFIYRKIISPILSVLFTPMLSFFEFIVYKSEIKNNIESMMSSVYIFKKLK